VNVPSPLTDAKHPVTSLAGPYGHPFHPILVTVPIGAWVASVVFDVVSRVGDDAAVFAEGAEWLIGIGIVGALLAALFGFLDLLAIPTGTRAFRTALTHMGLNLTVVVLFAVGFALRLDRLDDPDGTPIGLLVLSLVALVALGVSGWLGGKLTYRYGVRVVDETTQADGLGAERHEEHGAWTSPHSSPG
jgi:uncharacterized membrane protein